LPVMFVIQPRMLQTGLRTTSWTGMKTVPIMLLHAPGTEPCGMPGLVNDSTLINGSVDLYAPYLSGQRQPNMGHVDDNVFGIWPFGLYQQTNNSSYLTIARNLADDEFDPPRSGKIYGPMRGSV
jgi:hypothetical protein